jgi:simple sugar transport system substrate-binding protein
MKGSSSAMHRPEPPRILVLTHDLLGDPFWRPLRRGVAEAAAQLGCRVLQQRPERYSAVAMKTLLEQALVAGPDGLVTTLPVPDLLDPLLRPAILAGLPVIVLNTLDHRPPAERLPALCSIGAEDRDGGVLVAERLLAVRPCRRVLCVDHYHDLNTCHAQRVEGLRDRLATAEVVTTVLRVDGNDAGAASRAVLSTVGDARPPYDAVVTLGPPGWRCVEATLAARGDRILHASFDVTPEVLDAISDGRTLGTIDCQQYLQGYWAVLAMHMHLVQGYAPIGEILTGPRFVAVDDVLRLRQRLQAEDGNCRPTTTLFARGRE